MEKVIIKNSTTERLPSDELLEKAGWEVEASDPKTSGTPLADDGHTATDEPTKSKVVTDHNTPVTAAADDDEDAESKQDSENTDSKDDEETEETEKEASSTVLAAIRVADLENEVGLTSDWTGDKYARIAELEGYSPERLNERIATLTSVKSAGLTRKTAKTNKVSSLPRMAASGNFSDDVADEMALMF